MSSNQLINWDLGEINYDKLNRLSVGDKDSGTTAASHEILQDSLFPSVISIV